MTSCEQRRYPCREPECEGEMREQPGRPDPRLTDSTRIQVDAICDVCKHRVALD